MHSKYLPFLGARHIQLINPQVVGLYCLGYVQEAAELGFYVYTTRNKHPKYAIFLHSFVIHRLTNKRKAIGTSDMVSFSKALH